MESPAIVDPELASMLARPLLPELSEQILPAIRDAILAVPPDAPMPAIEPRLALAPGSVGAPDVPLLLFDPAGRTERAAILHIHGGGMILGAARMRTFENAALAARLRVLLVSVDYRLAPECSFPGPQQDCHTALAWIRGNAAQLNIDPDRIVVMGESAGGGLAAALTQMVRDNGEPTLLGQILTYPMLDHRTGSATCPYRNPASGAHVWTRASNQFGWESLRGSYALDDDRVGWFSPALAKSLADLPATFIAVGGLDLFVDEDFAYARRLNAAGVPVEFHLYPGAVHGFDTVPQSRVARQYRADIDKATAAMFNLALSPIQV